LTFRHHDTLDESPSDHRDENHLATHHVQVPPQASWGSGTTMGDAPRETESKMLDELEHELANAGWEMVRIHEESCDVTLRAPGLPSGKQGAAQIKTNDGGDYAA
jgi:hypothetical protein